MIHNTLNTYLYRTLLKIVFQILNFNSMSCSFGIHIPNSMESITTLKLEFHMTIDMTSNVQYCMIHNTQIHIATDDDDDITINTLSMLNSTKYYWKPRHFPTAIAYHQMRITMASITTKPVQHCSIWRSHPMYSITWYIIHKSIIQYIHCLCETVQYIIEKQRYHQMRNLSQWRP